VYEATSDPERPFVAPAREEAPPYLNFAPLENGSAALTAAASRYERALAKAQANGGAAYANAQAEQLNQKMIASEKAFLSEAGLPERPWFKHQIYAPGAYTGYGVKTIPAVREMLEEKKWKLAEQGAAVAGEALMREAALVDSAAQQLEAMEK
jgi:N-acetylated-alpha-linked acidic dipeptidase